MSIKISTLGCGPHVLWSVLHPSWFPLVLSDWGIWASTPETDWDSYPGDRSTTLGMVPLDLFSPKEGFSPGPLTSRLKRFPATRILPILVFGVVPGIEPLCETTANWKSLLTIKLWWIVPYCELCNFLYYTNWWLIMCIWWLYFSSWSPKGDLRIFFILSPVLPCRHYQVTPSLTVV